jgi:hypothetical protein
VAAWLTQCNPDKWRTDAFLPDGHLLQTWTVKRHLDEVVAGDFVLLWLASCRGEVVGIGHVTGPVFATTPEEADDGYWAPGEILGTTHQMPIQMALQTRATPMRPHRPCPAADAAVDAFPRSA